MGNSHPHTHIESIAENGIKPMHNRNNAIIGYIGEVVVDGRVIKKKFRWDKSYPKEHAIADAKLRAENWVKYIQDAINNRADTKLINMLVHSYR